MFQKKIQKYVIEVKFPALSNSVGRIGLNIEAKPENRKNPFISLHFEKFLRQKYHFQLDWGFLDYRKVNMNKKNNQTTIIDVKFDEESKSKLWIRLQDKEKPENRRDLSKK